MSFTSINPATGLVVATYTSHQPADVESRIEQAFRAQYTWRNVALSERVRIVLELASVLERHCEPIARLITQEMGKPLVQSRAEVIKCAGLCRHMAQIVPDVLADVGIEAGFTESTIRNDPLGLVLSIMPWNFPLWQFFRFAVPALLAGNGVLLKHAPTTMGCGLMAARLCHLAGLPEHIVTDLRIDVAAVEGVIADDRIRAVTFTGSTIAGSYVASAAGRHLKKSVMELGGSDPYIVCDDADIELAVTMCVTGRMINSGQSCIAAKRYLVHESIAEEFIQRVAQQYDSLVVGDPLDTATDVGPLARRDLQQQLQQQVEVACSHGARIATRQPMTSVSGNGFFVRPTLLVHVDPTNPVYNQELFGPVATVTTFTDDAHAVRLANGTDFGLVAAVCSSDISRAKFLADQLECGTVFINDFVRSEPRLPFGGVKKSGYGRELGSWGLLEFVNVKNITIG